jgi:hypothetical protein
MTNSLPAARLITLLIICMAAVALAVGGAAAAFSAHTVQHSAVASPNPNPNPYEG